MTRPDWLDKCDWCGWPLDKGEGSAGCHLDDCSMRPMPPLNKERHEARAYIATLEQEHANYFDMIREYEAYTVRLKKEIQEYKVAFQDYRSTPSDKT